MNNNAYSKASNETYLNMVTRDIKNFYTYLTRTKPIICIDYGKVNSGIAISDPMWKIAMPFDVICTNIDKILALIDQFNPAGVVIGLPINMNGTENCEDVIDFANNFNMYPVLLFDERLTSRLANQILKDTGVKTQKRRSIDHKIAASLILESVLNVMNNQIIQKCKFLLL